MEVFMTSNIGSSAGRGTAVQTAANLPKGKQTTLGLYVTAREAYAMWKADPEKVNVLDVRTPQEYLFIGHPEMARNIPVAFVKYEWDAEKNEPVMEPNPEFIALAKEAFKPKDTILVTCRSGGRSALAVNALSKAGFVNVYNITDGVEGDMVKDPESVFSGKRMKNGWKNSVPWTYDVNPDLLWIAR
jgi:rhodanese-related sulfurtransferase